MDQSNIIADVLDKPYIFRRWMGEIGAMLLAVACDLRLLLEWAQRLLVDEAMVMTTLHRACYLTQQIARQVALSNGLQF